MPSSILPGRVVEPAEWRRAATRVVFPTVLWPTTATFRSSDAVKVFIGGGLYKAVTDVRRQAEMDEENQRLSSRKAVVATLLLGAIALCGMVVFVLVLLQRACSGP